MFFCKFNIKYISPPKTLSMSTFDYPRLHVKGLTVINVGTANNDDYSSYFFVDGEYAGLPVRQADSNRVQAETYCMNDGAYLEWMQKRLLVYSPGRAAASDTPNMNKGTGVSLKNEGNYHLIPAEWNYYGDFDFRFKDAKVIGVDYGDGLVKDDPLLDADVSMNLIGPEGGVGGNTAVLIDTNPEGVTASVIIGEAVTLSKNNQALLSGKPTSAATRWINFQRNVVLNGPNGAAGTFQHAIPLDSLKGFKEGKDFIKKIPAKNSEGKKLAGLLFKYTLYRPLQEISTQKYLFKFKKDGFYNDNRYDQYLDTMEELYESKEINPDYCMVQGTITPWYTDEVKTLPIGRYLIPSGGFVSQIKGDLVGNTNPAQDYGLAPALVAVDNDKKQISLDISVSLPDQFTDTTFNPNLLIDNPKYNFGSLTFGITVDKQDFDIGSIDYTDTEKGDKKGWLFEFPFSSLPAKIAAQIGEGDFYLKTSDSNKLLSETPHLIVTDQPSVWAEQNPVDKSTTQQFMWDGKNQEVTFRVFEKGKELKKGQLTLSEYDVTPNQRVKPVALQPNMSVIEIGQPIKVKAQNPGVRFFTVQWGTTDCPPVLYDNLNVMTAAQFNLRILPNYENYDEYYVDPSAKDPVGNEKLTWEVLYNKVLRNYYLLYPAMNEVKPLNDAKVWQDPVMAGILKQYVDESFWMKYTYMPRTRDLSSSRRKLIQAWCNKIIKKSKGKDLSNRIIA